MNAAGKRKVAHLTSVHVPLDTRIAYRQCASLAEAGYDVVLVAAGEAQGLPEGVRFHGVRKPRNRFERMTRTMWDVYRAARAERADVYHFHDPELMGVGIALRARGARVVFDVHEDIPGDIADKPWIPKALRRPVAAASALALRLMHPLFDAVVTATPAIARRYRDDRVVVVENYPRIEELAPPQHVDFADRERRAIYLGAITELRCIEEMIAAMESPALGQNIRLALAGPFETPELERRVRAANGWNKVDYLGFCRRSEVGRTFTGARAGLLLFRPALNHEEAVPTKFFEYLGAGLPIIISDNIRSSAIVKEHDCGIVVKYNDVDAIARAITYLVENPAVAQAMGERGRQIVAERFQWATEAKKLKQLYAQIA